LNQFYIVSMGYKKPWYPDSEWLHHSCDQKPLT